jgi:hypothetical protein
LKNEISTLTTSLGAWLGEVSWAVQSIPWFRERLMIRSRYRVTDAFTVFRHGDKAPKHLLEGVYFAAHEPLADLVVLEIGSERFTSEKRVFLTHTQRSRNEGVDDSGDLG